MIWYGLATDGFLIEVRLILGNCVLDITSLVLKGHILFRHNTPTTKVYLFHQIRKLQLFKLTFNQIMALSGYSALRWAAIWRNTVLPGRFDPAYNLIDACASRTASQKYRQIEHLLFSRQQHLAAFPDVGCAMSWPLGGGSGISAVRRSLFFAPTRRISFDINSKVLLM